MLLWPPRPELCTQSCCSQRRRWRDTRPSGSRTQLGLKNYPSHFRQYGYFLWRAIGAQRLPMNMRFEEQKALFITDVLTVGQVNGKDCFAPQCTCICPPSKGGNQLTLASVWESRKMMTSAVATLAPANRAVIRPDLSLFMCWKLKYVFNNVTFTNNSPNLLIQFKLTKA